MIKNDSLRHRVVNKTEHTEHFRKAHLFPQQRSCIQVIFTRNEVVDEPFSALVVSAKGDSTGIRFSRPDCRVALGEVAGGVVHQRIVQHVSCLSQQHQPKLDCPSRP
jgi:hypothetical protein